MAAPQPHFRLLGFPVHVGIGFVVFMLLLAVIPRAGDQSFGWWLAGGVAVFTLIHELGHAVVARRAGAEAGISLEFMAGYTSYRATRPISRPWTVAISLAGPLTHIACGSVVLLAMGANPLSHDSVAERAATLAIWWAGPVIGLLNLVPILPLDGGHVATTAIDAAAPGKGERVMVYVSAAVTVAAMVSAAFFDITRQFIIFIAFLLIYQLSRLSEERRRASTPAFDRVAASAAAGDLDKAARQLAKSLSRQTGDHRLPKAIEDPQARAGIAAAAVRLDPLPHGDPYHEHLLALVLIRQGEALVAAGYAAESYETEPGVLPAMAVARAAGALGDAATAAAWLRTAVGHGIDRRQLAELVATAPEFAAVRNDPALADYRSPS